MIKAWQAGIIELLPKTLVNKLANKILNGYLNKYANLKVEGIEKIKDVKRPIIFICNHLSNSDALVLNKVLEKEDVTFVAGVKLQKYEVTNLGINLVKTTPLKPNTADKEGLTKIINILKSNGNVFIFPEGTRSRESKMIPGKKGIILIAKLTKATIVPIGIHGTEKLLPINNEDMTKEEFGYADVFVNVGDAITLPKKDQNEEKQEYEERCMNFLMGNIAKLLPEKYRGVYGERK